MTNENTTPTPKSDGDIEEKAESSPKPPLYVPDYPDPVDKLLKIGRVNAFTGVDYYERGIRKRHKADLIRMAIDEELHDAPSDTPWVWGPVHAWRALAQLGAFDAAETLIENLFWRVADDDDWVYSEMPLVFSLFGIGALPALDKFLDPDKLNGIEPRKLAVRTIMFIGQGGEMSRIAARQIMLKHLNLYEKHYPEFNALTAANIILLAEPSEAKELINKVLESGKVDMEVYTEEIYNVFDLIEEVSGVNPLNAVDENMSEDFDSETVVLPPKTNQLSQNRKKHNKKRKNRKKR